LAAFRLKSTSSSISTNRYWSEMNIVVELAGEFLVIELFTKQVELLHGEAVWQVLLDVDNGVLEVEANHFAVRQVTEWVV
jgi:hypothetical protein